MCQSPEKRRGEERQQEQERKGCERKKESAEAEAAKPSKSSEPSNSRVKGGCLCLALPLLLGQCVRTRRNAGSPAAYKISVKNDLAVLHLLQNAIISRAVLQNSTDRSADVTETAAFRNGIDTFHWREITTPYA